MGPKLKRTSSSLSRKSLPRLNSSRSTGSSNRRNSVKIQEENDPHDNDLNEVLEEDEEEDSNDNDDDEEEDNNSRKSHKHDTDIASVNSIEREMTLKDRQEVK